MWLFSNDKFYNALWKTITLRGRTFFRVSMIMPYATSVAAATLVFAQIFGRDAGAVNWLGTVGIDDGANRWQQFRHVTLPGLRPTILFTIVVSTIGASQLFGEPLIFGGGKSDGGAVNQHQTLGLFMYQQGWQYGSLGRAATVAWVTFVLIIGLVLVNYRLARRRDRVEKT